MFNSPTLSRSNKQQPQPPPSSSIDMINTKRIIDEKSKTIEQLKVLIDELKLRHERKERELLKRIGLLYNDLQQNKKKMAHLIYKHQQYQQQKKINENNNNNTKSLQDSSTQTDEHNLSSICLNCSSQLIDTSQCNDENIVQLLNQLQLHTQKKNQEQQPIYYTLRSEDEEVEDVEYISATPQPITFDPSLSSPALSTTDRSSTRSSMKHNESSSSAYNTAESLPSSTYSDEIESLERVLNAACTMYTTHNNLEHTIKLQEELFRQRLRLRGIAIDDDPINQSSSSEHLYDNIDDETSDLENQTTVYKNRLLPSHKKKSKHNVTLSTDDDEQQQQQQQKSKTTKCNKVRFIDQYHSYGKRKNLKTSSRTNLSKITNNLKRQQSNITPKKFPLPLSSNMLTVTIT